MIPQSLGTMTAYVALNMDQFNRAIPSINKKLAGVSQKLSQTGRTIALYGAVLAAPLVNAVRIFSAFDDKMRLTKAVTSATTQEFKLLTDQAKLLGRTTSFTASQVAEAMVELGRAGFAVKEIEQAIGPLLNMARATGTDLATAANIASSTLRAFVLDASRMVEVADVMTAAANNSAQTLTDLGESMKFAAPIAAEFNMSLQDTAKALATMANFSIRGSMAGTTLRMIMLRLAKTDVQEKLRGIGIEIERFGKIRSVSAILQETFMALRKVSKVERLSFMNELFGARAISGGMKLAQANFEGLNQAIDNAGGTAQKTADEMDAGLGGALRLLWSAVEGVNIAIGEGLDKAIRGLSAALRVVLGPVTKFIERNKGLVVGIGALAASMIGFGGILMATAVGLKVVVFLLGGYVMVLKAVKAMHILIAANPAILGLIAFGAAIVAVVLIIRKYTQTTATLTNTMSDLLGKKDEQRRMDDLRMVRLRQLSDKEELNNKEMEEAASLVDTLNGSYDGLNLKLDTTTGKVNGLTTAQKKLDAQMKVSAISDIQAAMGETQANIDAMMKEVQQKGGGQGVGELFTLQGIGNLFSPGNAGEIDAISSKLEAAFVKLQGLQKKMLTLQGKGEFLGGSGEGDEEGPDIAARIEAEQKRVGDAAAMVLHWEKRIRDIKIAGIENVFGKEKAEINKTFDLALDRAEGNSKAIALIEQARKMELGRVGATMTQKWEQNVQDLRIGFIKDEHERRFRETNLRYAREMEKAKGNIAAQRLIQEAWDLERAKVLDAQDAAAAKKPESLAALAEKGTASAFSTIVNQEQKAANKTAKNTEAMVNEQKKTNKIMAGSESRYDAPILNLALA